MSHWLQNTIRNCCDELEKIAKRLQDIEQAFSDANAKYYQSALETLASEIHQEEGACAFVAAVNVDINRSAYKIAGLGHVCSAIKVLRAAITKASQIHDAELATIVYGKVPQAALDKLITDVLGGQQLNNILCAGDICADAWSSAVKAVETRGAGEALQGLTNSIKSLLQDWAEEMKNAYSTFWDALGNFKYLSARDLYSYMNRTQGTEKPITITPYTTKDGQKGLLITIAGTDPIHQWDDDLITALMTGANLSCNPYMLDVKNAIEAYMEEHKAYMEEHSEMQVRNVTLVGYSLGGMIAQNCASLLHSAEKTALSHYGLRVTHVVTYGSPVMKKPVDGVQYAMYDATYDPVPLLSVHENPLLSGQVRKLTGELAQNRLNLIIRCGDFIRAWPALRRAWHSIVKAEQECWCYKLDDYIDRKHVYREKIFHVTDVGNVLVNMPIVHILDLVLNLKNHFQYGLSDMVNAQETAQRLPDIDPETWGPTEYFGMQALIDFHTRSKRRSRADVKERTDAEDCS